MLTSIRSVKFIKNAIKVHDVYHRCLCFIFNIISIAQEQNGLSEQPFLAWLLTFRKSFASLVCRIFRLSTTRQTRHANDFVNAKSHVKEKPLLTGDIYRKYFEGWIIEWKSPQRYPTSIFEKYLFGGQFEIWNFSEHLL